MYPAAGGSYGSLNVSASRQCHADPAKYRPIRRAIVYFQSRDNKKTASVSGNGIVASWGAFLRSSGEVMLTAMRC